MAATASSEFHLISSQSLSGSTRLFLLTLEYSRSPRCRGTRAHPIGLAPISPIGLSAAYAALLDRLRWQLLMPDRNSRSPYPSSFAFCAANSSSVRMPSSRKEASFLS